MAKKQKQETFYTYLREDAASLLFALFAIVMIARPADAGFFDWLNNLFSGPNAPIEQAQMVNAQTSTQSCYGKYPEKTSCESAGCTWYQNHYDGTHCDDTAHGQAATTSSSKPLCADGIDNDGDGKIDYPNDDGCYGPDDWSEDIPTATGTGTGIGAPANTTGTPSCSSTPSLCASQAECTAYNFSWSKTTNSCYSNASMCTGDCVGPRSATSPTTPPATTATPPPATATTPPATTATQGTGSTTFSGDANTCPGFSYSKWDTSGKRYCQLNNEEKCDANYPSYMDQANYKKENCPAQTHRQHTWQFSDGTAMSSIINRTDSEFTVYIADIEKQCRTISKNNFTWKPRAGDGATENWKEFGIPDCTKGATTVTPATTTDTSTTPRDADADRRAEEQRRIDDERYREEERRRAEERHRKDEKQQGEERRREEERRFQNEKQREEERQHREEEFRRRDEEHAREEGNQRDDERRRAEEEIRRGQEEQKFESERFEQMKREMSQFLRGISQMEREAERAKKRLDRCELTLPANITDTINQAKSIGEKIKAATNVEELEKFFFEIEEVGFQMREWGPRMGGLDRSCDMLANAERELKRLDREHEQIAKRAERSNIDATLSLGKLREIKRKMEETLVQARALTATDPEEAAILLEDGIFFRIESYHNTRQAVEMAINLSQGLKDADRELAEFDRRIKELKQEGRNTKRMEALLAGLHAQKQKLERLSKSGRINPDDAQEIIEEAFDIRDELIGLLQFREKGRFFESEEEDFDDFEGDIDVPETFAPDAKRRAVFEAREKGGIADAQVQTIKEKAGLLANDKLDQILSELQQLRDVVKEQEAEIKFLKNLSGDLKKLSAKMQENINGFVAYGVDANSQKLGAGERAAVLHSYEAAYGALPEDEKGLEDMIKIVNGRFPSQRSSIAEKQARKVFQKIFKRVANLNNDNDNAAIMVMAYGLRQSAKNRKLDSEKKGIETFRAIFNKVPQTTEEWNTMQAITYSGATRKPDKDKDGLADEDEAVFGTNPDVADTDGDGIPDGTEVDEGFDPLQK